eukprot:1368765-Prymnesium_polylepis.1
MPSSGYAHAFWQIPGWVDCCCCCCRMRFSCVSLSPVASNESSSIGGLAAVVGFDDSTGRAGGSEVGKVLVSTMNGFSERHSSLKVHSAPRLALMEKSSGAAGAE